MRILIELDDEEDKIGIAVIPGFLRRNSFKFRVLPPEPGFDVEKQERVKARMESWYPSEGLPGEPSGAKCGCCNQEAPDPKKLPGARGVVRTVVAGVDGPRRA